MNEKTIPVPITTIDGNTWFLLKHFSDSWVIRSANMDKKPQDKQDPNHHHVFEIGAKGAVKCRAKKEWDITDYLAKNSSKSI
ncbi:MAG: hypothetical protein COT15_00375 [Candidatus Diapherotrites archaeon CG08_land_8_20_14_0_20_34_12]|nr:MAG: hypothetical protein COT15_00375 [Candidatus Diapherotrites archaeon CG08_land_8_20_14_0_20_34_12]